MKKSTLLLAGLLAANVASADEGMWTSVSYTHLTLPTICSV